jgi:hypothetical protein
MVDCRGGRPRIPDGYRGRDLLGTLMDAGMLEFLALVAAGVLGCALFRKLRVRPRGSASVET